MQFSKWSGCGNNHIIVMVPEAKNQCSSLVRSPQWDRCCGITAACGTGSCAALVAAQKRDLAGNGAESFLTAGNFLSGMIFWKIAKHRFL